MNSIEQVCQEVHDELLHAMHLHDDMKSLHEAYAVILEELDEFWEQVKINPKKMSPEAQQERLNERHKELVQVAAMCIRCIIDQKI